jgi:hypothetical protein
MLQMGDVWDLKLEVGLAVCIIDSLIGLEIRSD